MTPVVLVLGDEELLVARAIAETAAQVRAVDPQAEVRELDASGLLPGELAELLSPSLFGGNRVAVLLDGQDAKKELVAVVLDYLRQPDPEVTLVVTHAGGAKGKAFADSLTKAGATVVGAAKLTKHRERVDFVTGEFRRLGGKCGADAAEALLEAVGNDLRELAAACAQLTADTGGRIDVETVARYYRGKAEVSGFTVADAAVAGTPRRPSKRCAGPCIRAWTRYPSRMPWPTECAPSPAWRRPGVATRFSWRPGSACPRGRSKRRNGRRADGLPTAW
jgi:DNA polymerase-3 subunit delta